jgi:lysozyme
MNVSQNGVNFTKQFEGCRLSAYLDIAGVPTIGFGTTFYENGNEVELGETITMAQAISELTYQLSLKGNTVNHLIGAEILTQNQYDSLVDFCYNEGSGALAGSTLLKKVLANSSDPTITDSFLVWDKAHIDGKLVEVEGLLKRRQAEATLYFS